MFDYMGFLKSIDFIRLGGSCGEHEAAELIAEQMKKIGLVTEMEEFDIQAFEPGTAFLEILEPYQAKYDGFPIGYSGSFDKELELHPLPITVDDVSRSFAEKVVMFSERADYKGYESLRKNLVPAAILINSPYRNPQYTCYPFEAVKDFGLLPGISLSYDDCAEVVNKKARLIRLHIEEVSYPAKSKNVIGTFPFDDEKLVEDEEIIICAHYDSVATSKGMIDNACGTAIMLMIADRLMSDDLPRKVRFIAFGSEELGLRGSKYYASKHDLKSIRFVVNIDIAGDVLGNNFAKVTGEEEILNHIDAWKKMKGFSLKTSQDIYSSDNMPFCKEGIPAVSFGRGGASSYFVHWSADTIENINSDAIDDTAKIVEKFVREIAGSEIFPFKKIIPADIEKKVAGYFENRWNT